MGNLCINNNCKKCNGPYKDNMSCRVHRIDPDTNTCIDCNENVEKYCGNCYHRTHCRNNKNVVLKRLYDESNNLIPREDFRIRRKKLRNQQYDISLRY